MNFKPSDYLTDLNLDFSEDFQINSNLDSSNDLDLFSKNDFYNLDFQDYKSKSPISPISPETITVKPEPEEPTLKAANDDKRKRNTAASARFRIKKKMKEQQMEQKSKELQDKVQSLEKKLLTLEMENKCLKNFLLKKNEQENTKLLEQIKKRSIGSESLFEYTK